MLCKWSLHLLPYILKLASSLYNVLLYRVNFLEKIETLFISPFINIFSPSFFFLNLFKRTRNEALATDTSVLCTCMIHVQWEGERPVKCVVVCRVKLHFLSPCHCCARDVGPDKEGLENVKSFSLLLPHNLSKNSLQKEKAAKSRLYLLHCQWF